MLQKLKIENFALIQNLELHLPPGFIAVTGETGAGKSMLLAAVAACLGGRLSKDQIATTGQSLKLSATFVPSGSDGSNGHGSRKVLCERVIRPDGRSRYGLQGHPSTQKELRELAPTLLDMHGQRDQNQLLDPDRHAELLDTMPRIAEIRKQHKDCWNQWQQASQRLVELQRSRDRDRERRELWTYQLRELCALDAKVGEDDELGARQRALSHIEEIKTGCGQAAQTLLEADHNLSDQLAAEVAQLSRMVEWDRGLSEPLEQLQEALLLLQEGARSLANYGESLEDDPEALARTNERLSALDTMIRKYGGTLDSLLVEQQQLDERLYEQDSQEQGLASARRTKEELETRLALESEQLSRVRHKGAVQLSSELNLVLKELGLSGDGLRVHFEPLSGYQEIGAERPRFLVSTNPDMPAAPLEEIASGGELSRIMLGFKTVLGEDHRGRCLIFDEIDTGLSGKAALAVAEQLNRLARHHQVICITHLPQIAAAAEHQLGVEKNYDGRRTRINVRLLDESGRLEHIAQLQSGKSGSAEIAAAQRLLKSFIQSRKHAR